MNIIYELKNGKCRQWTGKRYKAVPVRRFTFNRESYSKKLVDELNEASRETGLKWELINSNKYGFTVQFN